MTFIKSLSLLPVYPSQLLFYANIWMTNKNYFVCYNFSPTLHRIAWWYHEFSTFREINEYFRFSRSVVATMNKDNYQWEEICFFFVFSHCIALVLVLINSKADYVLDRLGQNCCNIASLFHTLLTDVNISSSCLMNQCNWPAAVVIMRDLINYLTSPWLWSLRL